VGWTCVPAFARDSDTKYVSQASSTVAMCMKNNVRVLIWILFFVSSSLREGEV